MTSLKNVWIAMIVVAIIAVIGVFTPTGKSVIQSFGGVTNYDELDAKAIKIGGSNGSRIGPIISGTCSLVSDSSIAATSTGTGTCAVTGAVAGDIVMVSLSTTTTKIAAQWQVIGTVATTDSVTVRLLNLTGTAAVPSATNGFGSSTQYYLIHPVSSVPGL